MIGSKMKIIYNGEEKEFEECFTIADLLEQLEPLPKLFVIERNHEIIYKEEYLTEPVVEGDSIELVTFTGGG